MDYKLRLVRIPTDDAEFVEFATKYGWRLHGDSRRAWAGDHLRNVGQSGYLVLNHRDDQIDLVYNGNEAVAIAVDIDPLPEIEEEVALDFGEEEY